MGFTYSAKVDWDWAGSGTPDFTGTHDNITAYIMRCSGSQGINKETENVTSEGKCSLTLKNTDRRFSPKNSGSPLYGKLLVGKPVLIQGVEGSTVTTFFGTIKSITPKAGAQASGTNGVMSERTCEIECIDPIGKLRQSKFSVPVLTQRYAQELIQVAANRALEAPFATTSFTFSGNPSPGDTVAFSQTINGVSYGGTYTYVSSLGSVANEVLIGATKEESLEYLCAAINGGAGAGTTYTNATRPLGIATAVPQGYRYTVLPDAPVRFYHVNEPSGTNADDIGSNAADATLMNGAAFGASGLVVGSTAVTLDGTDDYISAPPLDFGNRSFSIELWFRGAASPPANQDVWSIFGAFAAKELAYLRLASNGQITLDFYLTGGAIQSAVGAVVVTAINHIVVTYDYSTTTAKIIVNSAEVASGTVGPYTGTATPIIQVGGFTAAGANYVKGTVDEPAIYFKALTPERIAAHYGIRLTGTGIKLTATLSGTVGNGIGVSISSAAFSGGGFSGGSDYPTYPANNFEATDALIPFAGDDWQSDSTNAMTAITDVVKSEGTALFWAQRDGSLEFKNRGFIFRQGADTPTLTLDSEFQDAQATLSDEDVYNSVEVTIKPRRLKAVGVVGKLNSPVQVPGSTGKERWDYNVKVNGGVSSFDSTPGSKVIKVQFTDPDTGLRCAAQNVVLPLVASTHYTLNEQSDGSGVEYTYGDPATGILYVFFSVIVNANNIEVSVVNKALGDLYVRKLEIEGEALVKYEPITALAEDAASQLAYGKRTLAVNLPLGSSQPFAEAFAAYLLARYKEPQFRVKQISFNNITSVGGVKLHALRLGDVISYSDYQHAETGALYMIRGVSWDWGSPASGRFTTNFDVYKLDEAAYGVFDAAAPRGKFDQAVFGL